MKYKLDLTNLMSTATEPVTKFIYEDGEKTDKISGYSYRLLDIENGEPINVVIPKLIDIPPRIYVNVVDAIGTPYKNQNDLVQMSIKAKDIRKAN